MPYKSFEEYNMKVTDDVKDRYENIIKDLGEHPEDKKPVRIMKGQYGPYIKHKSLNATIPEEKDPLEINMEEALILIEKRREYDKSKKKTQKQVNLIYLV